MPELPEVETIKRDLEQHIINRKIINVSVYDKRVLKNITIPRFKTALTNRNIKKIFRKGKSLAILLDNGKHITIQLKMTGQLIYDTCNLKETYNNKATKLCLQLSNETYLNYNDQRIFGKWAVIHSLEDFNYFRTLGLEPLSKAFDEKAFKNICSQRKAPIKNILMNQTLIAGIGNIYASEVLYCAGINPKKQARLLNEKEIVSIVKAVKRILKEAIALRGTSFRDYRDAKGRKGNFLHHLKVYGREKQNCVKCKNSIERIVQAGRSTFYCKFCQKD